MLKKALAKLPNHSLLGLPSSLSPTLSFSLPLFPPLSCAIPSAIRKMEVGAPSRPSEPADRSMYKNWLQEFTQRAAIHLPVYQTTNEGLPHAPQFRSTVVVDGIIFTSSGAYVHRKAAEQDVAKVALEGISAKIKHEGVPLIQEDSSFCKSILHEYAVKMDLEKPTYTTSQAEGLLPIFISSAVFNGKTFTGSPAKNKKEAEQLAARAVIESILANSNTRTIMCEIIKSKGKLYAAVHKYSYSGLLCDKNVAMGSETLENGNGCAMKRQEIQAILSNDDKLPGNTGGILASVTATQSFLLQAMKTEEGYTCKANSGSRENSFGPYGAQGVPSSAMICYSNNSTKESNLEETNQVIDGMKQIAHYSELGNSSSVAYNRGRKRSNKKQKKRNGSKKARSDEQLPAPLASYNTENPQQNA